MQDDELKQRLELFILQYQSSRGRLQLLNSNFRLNISRVTKVVDELEGEFRDKTVYIVAAGPSLNKDIWLLSKVSKEAVIVATGAVLKKLLLSNIIRYYCIITDPGEVVYLQTKGIEHCNVP